MGIFHLLQGARRKTSALDDHSREKLMQAWGLERDELAERRPERTAEGTRLDYDRVQWERKLKHILDELPESEPRWEPLMREARALGFDEAWARRVMTDEFALMVRRAVADRLFSERERRKLDLARYLIGLTEEEAEAITRTIVQDAESFFGEHVEGT